MRLPLSAFSLLLLLLFGCVGRVSSLPGDDESGRARNRPPPIILMSDDDGGASMADAGAGEDGAAASDARATDSATQPPDPCDGVVCGAGASCEPASGDCVCSEGFRSVGGGCEAIPAGDPAGRTTAEVCAAWSDGHVENARPAWTAGATACDPGTLTDDAYEDTVRRVNLFRWLAGLGPVTHDASEDDAMQACAVMMDQNNALSHMPPSTWQCYSAEGAAAAGRSNIALGAYTPGQAIDLYMADDLTPSLGHRRWILNDYLGQVGIGFAGRAQCLGVFDSSGGTDRTWTAYPNPGPAPIETTADVWSFHSHAFDLSAATVTLERLGTTSENIPVSVSHISGGFGPPGALAFTPPVHAAAGDRFRITIGGLAGDDIVYETEIVDCH